MSGWDVLLKLIEQYPGSMSVFTISCLAFVAYVAITIDRLRMFQKRIDNLVTKKDLQIAFQEFELRMRDHFVTNAICDRREADTQVRVARLEKEILSGRRKGTPEDT